MRKTLIAAAWLAASACSQAPSLVGPSAPLALVATYDQPAGPVRTLDVNSCPDGSAPAGFWVDLGADGRTIFHWEAIPNVTTYYGELERMDVTNVWLPAGTFSAGGLERERWVRLGSEGRYRARIRTLSCRTHVGPWSAWLEFSTGGDSDSGSGAAATPTGPPYVPCLPPPGYEFCPDGRKGGE